MREPDVPLLSLPEPLAVRAVEAADQDFLDELYFHSRQDLHQAVPDPAALRQFIVMQQRIQEAGFREHYPQATQWILLSRGERAGRLVVDASGSDLRVVDIAIAPAARRGGVARAVLQALQARAHAGGLTVSLAVARTNAAARALYQGLGFTVRSDDGVMEQRVWRSAASE